MCQFLTSTEGNLVADGLAKHGSRCSNMQIFLYTGSPYLRSTEFTLLEVS